MDINIFDSGIVNSALLESATEKINKAVKTDQKLAFYRGTLLFGQVILKNIFKKCKNKNVYDTEEKTDFGLDWDSFATE